MTSSTTTTSTGATTSILNPLSAAVQQRRSSVMMPERRASNILHQAIVSAQIPSSSLNEAQSKLVHLLEALQIENDNLPKPKQHEARRILQLVKEAESERKLRLESEKQAGALLVELDSVLDC